MHLYTHIQAYYPTLLLVRCIITIIYRYVYIYIYVFFIFLIFALNPVVYSAGLSYTRIHIYIYYYLCFSNVSNELYIVRDVLFMSE